jgi:hypothetical protein
MWNEGDPVVLRGMYEGRPVYIQSARVVKDGPAETVLAVWPGAECAAPAGYIQQGHGQGSTWNRWQETFTDTLHLERYLWHTNRFLILLEPEKFFSIIYVWDHATNEFICYYVNFQIPFKRNRLGFDTLDLDLDIVIEPDYRWHWKDVDDYQRAIAVGGIKPAWISEVEQAWKEIDSRLQNRTYPLDGKWLAWSLPPCWSPPGLPSDWGAAE